MDKTDVKWDFAGFFPFTEDQLEAFPSGGTQQIVRVPGRIKGWWILTNAGETGPFDAFGACFIDLHDGFSDSDPLLVRIGVSSGGVDDYHQTARYRVPGNGIRFDDGVFLRCTPIELDGTFFQMSLFVERAGEGISDHIVYPT